MRWIFAETVPVLGAIRQTVIVLGAFGMGLVFVPDFAGGQDLAAVSSAKAAAAGRKGTGAESEYLPAPLTTGNFAGLKQHSPFLRTLNVSKSLILTGVAKIDEETVATMLDL
ncbi:MAG: hypothetical protein P1V20_22000 [Verrucomicrobiales bacterium]|nr:hypothetical protein [Verrucomicrobiales bacterium]